MNTDAQKPSDSSGGRTRLLLGIACLTTILLLRTYVLSPRRIQLEHEESRVEALVGYTKKTTDVASVALADDLTAIMSRLAQLERSLTGENELVGHAPSLIALARRMGLDPGRAVPDPPISDGPYARHRFSLTVKGDYRAITGFVAAVADLPTIIVPAVTSIEFGLSHKENPPTNPGHSPTATPIVDAPNTTRAKVDSHTAPGRLTAELRIDAFAMSPGFEPFLPTPPTAGGNGIFTERSKSVSYPSHDGPGPFLEEDIIQKLRPSLEDLRLAGVIVSPVWGRSVAIFLTEDSGDEYITTPGRLHRLHVGERVGGVTVMSINLDSVAVAVHNPFGTTLRTIPVARSVARTPDVAFKGVQS